MLFKIRTLIDIVLHLTKVLEVAVNEICLNVQIYLTTIFGFRWVSGRAGRCSWGKIILSQEQTERSSTIPSFQKNNK